MTADGSARRASTDDPSRPEPEAAVDSSVGGRREADDRLARLEARFDTEVKYLATKEDIQKVKVWILVGVLGGMIAAAGIAIGILSLVLHTPS